MTIKGTREYRCEDPLLGGMTVLAPPTACVFCDHCTDVFWDYDHGPYASFCDLDADVDKGVRGECDRFEESE